MEELDTKLVRAREMLREMRITLNVSVEQISRTQRRQEEVLSEVRKTQRTLTSALADASDKIDRATDNVIKTLATEGAIDTLIPQTKAKAALSWKRPNNAARIEAARDRNEAVIPAWFSPCCTSCYQPIRKPVAGDWLSEHMETGQSYRSFERLSFRVRPHAHVKVIELLVIGPWPEAAPDLEAVRNFTECFFLGCMVRICRKTVPVSKFAARARQGTGIC